MKAFGSIASLLFVLMASGDSLFGQGDMRAGPEALTSVQFRGHAFVVRWVDPKKEDLQLFWKDDAGRLLHDFTTLDAEVKKRGERLLFAANAGMFQPDYSAVGLLVINGEQLSPLNLQEGAGNFYLKPNGVFVLTAGHEAAIMETSSYTSFLPPVAWATQSGPLVVHQGDIHPDLVAGSANLMIRSGVGVRKDGAVVFVLSREPINFYDFASFLLIKMRCPNALYLDGHISAFYVPGEAEKPGEHLFGQMFGVVAR